MNKTLYEILGVDKCASQSDIKKAFAKLVRKYPPETDGENYKRIRHAYDILMDSDLKMVYDEEIGNVTIDKDDTTKNNKSKNLFKFKDEVKEQTENVSKNEHEYVIHKSFNTSKIIIIMLLLVLIGISLMIFSKLDSGLNNYSNVSSNKHSEDKNKEEIHPEIGEDTKELYEEESYNYIDFNIPETLDIYFNVYTNAYKNEKEALKEVNDLKKKGIKGVVSYENDYYKVMVGNSDSLQGARDIHKKMSSKFYEKSYILVYDRNLEDLLNNVKSYMENNDTNLAKVTLNDIKYKVNEPGYEGYKKEYNKLKNALESYISPKEMTIDKTKIQYLLDDIFYNYGLAIESGNLELMYPYVTYDGDSYKTYQKSIPRYYEENIHVSVLDYEIQNINIEEDDSYRVRCLTNYSIANSKGSRYQTEESDYMIKKDSTNGKLLLDRIENWKKVE